MTDQHINELAHEKLIESCGIETADALVEWYNIRPEDLDLDDMQRLVALDTAGQFYFFDCGSCGEPVRYACPDSWNNFQGVNQDESLGELCEECAGFYLKLKELAGED